ncbi:hypothetical protein RI367_003855 [Sorochytrium milnesiophthora]
MPATQNKKLVAVLGATGAQGGSVARTLLRDYSDKYAVRALTRDPTSATAQDLVKLGAEAVACDVNDHASLEGAFSGAYAVFAVTTFADMAQIESNGPEFEIIQGKNIELAAQATNIQHLIWSSLDNIKKLSGGRFSNVHHFTSKATVEERLLASGLPVSVFVPGVYMTNYFAFPQMRPKKSEDGSHYELSTLIRGDVPLPLIDIARDTGLIVATMLEKRDQVLGKRIYGFSEYLTPRQMADVISDWSGKKVVYKHTPVPYAALEHMSLLEGETVGMFMWFDEFGYYNSVDTSITDRLVRNRSSFRAFLEREKPTL